MQRRRSRRREQQRTADSASDDSDSIYFEPLNSEQGDTENHDTPSPANSSTPSNNNVASIARLAKRRLFRSQRNEPRRAGAALRSSLDGGAARSSPRESGGSFESTDEYMSDDTIGSLPNEPITWRMSNDETQQSASHPPPAPATSAHDYIPPPSVPGAVHARGRAFGEIPQWIRRQYNTIQHHGNNAQPAVGLMRRRGRGGSERSFVMDSPGGRTTSSASNTRSQLVPVSSSSSLGGSSHQLRRFRPLRPARQLSSNTLTGSVRNLFSSLLSGSSLPEAEPLDSETVVYAEVIDDYDDEETAPVCSPEIVLYSIFLISVGILIGRITSSS
jgi:hypothetical protein